VLVCFARLRNECHFDRFQRYNTFDWIFSQANVAINKSNREFNAKELAYMYNEWVAEVKANVPNEKLLIFAAKDGWKPPSEGANDEGPNKRRRKVVGIEDAESTSNTLSLTSLNDNCLVRMLSNLPFQDLNTFAACNHQCRERRRHESLDQTRLGTIVCDEDSTIRSLFNAIVNNERNNAFTGNRTHVRIESFERLVMTNMNSLNNVTETLVYQAQMLGVNGLDLSQNPLDDERAVYDDGLLLILARILPYLREVNLSYVQTVHGMIVASLGTSASNALILADYLGMAQTETLIFVDAVLSV
jgi:hypothetical protein